MIKHLKVPDREAQNAKDFLESIGALNTDFLPFKGNGFILWPLNFKEDTLDFASTVDILTDFEGEVVEFSGIPATKTSRDYRKKLPKEIQEVAQRAFDIFGDIAIIRLPDELSESSDSIAQALLGSNPNISKVALDLGVEGQYRLRKLELIGGEPGFVSVHKENGLTFKLDISKVYFSPRLAMERQRISELVNSGERILDAFAGAAPFSVTLAKRGCRVTAVDANPDSEKWAHGNFHLNHIPVSDYDFIRSRIEDVVAGLDNYDRIIMNNPTKSLSYVNLLSPLVRPGGYIHLYCMAPKDGSFNVMENFDAEFECTRTREVHPYSPTTSLMVFDLKRAISNVQSGNQ